MGSRILIFVIGGVLAIGCGRKAGFYAVPPQQSTDLGHDPGGLGPFVTMDDPSSDEYIVHDISPQRDHHRWAFLHPELRFRVNEPRHLKFAAEFAIPQATFQTTGPVTVSASMNGARLATIRCDHAGDYRMQSPVPDGLIAPGQEFHVTFDANPRWVSPEDGAELSFYLRSAGFTR